MEYKLLEEKDIYLMEEVLKDDNMLFNIDYYNTHYLKKVKQI